MDLSKYANMSDEQLNALPHEERAALERELSKPTKPAKQASGVDLSKYANMSDEELNALPSEERAALEKELSKPQLQEGELDTTPVSEQVAPPSATQLQGAVTKKTWLNNLTDAAANATNDAEGVAQRAISLPINAVTGAAENIGKLGGAIWNQVSKDPVGSALEVARTGIDLSPMAGLTEYLPINQMLGGRDNETHDTLNALAFGIGNSVGDLAKGTWNLPGDVVNTTNYVFTGNNSPIVKPTSFDFLSPNERNFVNQTIQKEPLAAGMGGIEPYFIPIPGLNRAGNLTADLGKTLEKSGLEDQSLIRRMARGGLKADANNVTQELANALRKQNAGKKLSLFGKTVADSIHNPAVGLGVETATGLAAEPEGATVTERAKGRGAMAALSLLPTAAGYAGKVVADANKVEKVMASLHVNKETAQAIIKAGHYDNALKLADKAKATIEDANKGLKPEQTAAFKKYNPAGPKESTVQELMQQGKTRKEALALHRQATKASQGRENLSYLDRQKVDADVNRILMRDKAPFPGARTANLKALGGKKGLEYAKNMVLIQQSKQLAKMLRISPVQAKGILAGLRLPLEEFGGGETLSVVDSLQRMLGLLPTGNLLSAVPKERGEKIMNTILEHWSQRSEENSVGRRMLNQIKDEMALENTAWVNKTPSVLSAPIKDVKEFLNTSIKDGTLYKVMRGDTAGMKPEVVARLQKTADKLAEFNKTKVIPQLRKIYDTPEFDKLRLEDFKRGLSYTAEDIFKRSFTKQELKDLAQKAFDDYKNGTMTQDEAKELGAYVEYDPYHVTNAQTGQKFFSLNLKEVRKVTKLPDYKRLLDEFNIGSEDEFDANGKLIKMGNPIIGVGYGDSMLDAATHFNDAKIVYKDKFPFLYDKSGKFNIKLLQQHDNSIKFLADMRNAMKLGKDQLQKLNENKTNFIEQAHQLSGMDKKELNDLFNENIIHGNVKDFHNQWSKFVGSLQRGNDKLIMRNVDPFNGMARQVSDLSKKIHVEPIVNELRQARQAVLEKAAEVSRRPESLLEGGFKNRVLGWRYRNEAAWYDELDAMYRNVPTILDQKINEFADAMPDTRLNNKLRKSLRSYGDMYVGLQSLLKLGGNFTAGMINTIESWHSLAPQAYGHIDWVLEDLWNDIHKSGLHPIKFLENIALDAKDNPAVFFITGKTRDELNAVLASGKTQGALGNPAKGMSLGNVSDSAYASTDKYFGSRSFGVIRDTLMFPFQAGTDLNHLMAYRYLKSLGKRMGKTGAELEDWTAKMMTEHKVLTEFDKVPLTSRSQAAKVAFVFMSYLVRVADHAKMYYGRVLQNPSSANITKAMMFDLAPAIMFGAKSGVSLSLAADAANSVLGLNNLASDKEEPPVTDQLRVSDNPFLRILGKGAIAEFTPVDVSNLMTRDPMQMVGIRNLLAVSESTSLVRQAGDIYKAMGMLFDGDTSNNAAATDIIAHDVGDAARTSSVLGNRAAKGLDIFKTGQVRDRQGNKIVDLPDQSTFGRAKEGVLETLGITNAKAQDEQTAAKLLKNKAIRSEEDAKYYRKHIEQTMRDIADVIAYGNNSPEDNAKIDKMATDVLQPLVATLNSTSLTGLSRQQVLDLVVKPLENMNKTGMQRAFEALPRSMQLKLLSDPNTRKIFERFQPRALPEVDTSKDELELERMKNEAEKNQSQDVLNSPAVDVYGNYDNGGR